MFGILSAKLHDLAMQAAAVNKLVLNRIALALFCICSRIPNGLDSFASQAFLFFGSPEFQSRGSGPQLIALEMLSVMPGEVNSVVEMISVKRRCIVSHQN